MRTFLITPFFSVFLLVNVLAVCQMTEAHDPDVDFRNAETYFTNMEKNLNTSVINLNRLEVLQTKAYDKWSSASASVRKSSLEAIKNFGTLDYLGFIEKAGDVGVNLWKTQSLESALTSLVEAAQDAYTGAKQDECLRDDAYVHYLDILNEHNEEHDPTTTSADEDPLTKANHTITVTTYQFPCGGPCGQTFTTPAGDHWKVCGHGTDVTIAAWNVARQIKSNPTDELESTYPNVYDAIVNKDARLYSTIRNIEHIILGNRSVDEGCGRGYYSCNQDSEDLHSIRTCQEQRTWVDENGSVTTGTCNEKFRNCIGHSIDHDPTDDDDTETPHIGLSPSDGLYAANAGDSHTVQLSMLSKAASIGFYVITPNDAINDVSTSLGTASGDGTSTAATMTYTFPSGVAGDYTFYATVSYNDGTSESPHPSYTVTVALPASSPGLSTVNASTITKNGEIMMDTALGDTITVNLVMPDDKGYSLIYWYLADPGVSGYGNELGSTPIPSGSGIETEVSYTFSMPSVGSGVYTFTAYIYPHSSASDQSVYEYTLKIYCD